MNTKEITDERLTRWNEIVNDQKEIPQILITLEPKSSKLGVLITEDMPLENVRVFLTYILNNLKE
jgi:hypothetical protein